MVHVLIPTLRAYCRGWVQWHQHGVDVVLILMHFLVGQKEGRVLSYSASKTNACVVSEKFFGGIFHSTIKLVSEELLEDIFCLTIKLGSKLEITITKLLLTNYCCRPSLTATHQRSILR
jgi:hypothetical protein